jgi:hypothetical protein
LAARRDAARSYGNARFQIERSADPHSRRLIGTARQTPHLEETSGRSNENTNGLLRPYFPKDTDLSVHSQAYLNQAYLNKVAQLPVDVGESRFEDITDWLPCTAVELN